VRSVAVARADEIAPGERKLVSVGGRSIGVFNLGGEYYALRNRCPHQGGPLCEGFQFAPLRAAVPGEPYARGDDGAIIRCPWHGWEFDLRTGRSWFDPQRTRVRSYRARVVTGAELASPDTGEPPAGPGAAPLQAETYPARREGDYVVVELDG
jgi:nitrite reductase/ring-hydroxylating ferredoxin subunit